MIAGHCKNKEESMRYFILQLVFLLLLTAGTSHAQDPVSADNFAQRGISRFEKHDFEGAISDFTKAIELNGQNLEFCFYFRSIALYRLNRPDEAIADLSKAMTLKQHPRFYNDRGNLLAQQGDLDRAIADLNRAIEIDPKYAKAYGDRGIVRLMRGEDKAAELDFGKCFELDSRLESQFKAAANQIRQQAVLRTEHQKPPDVEIVKFNWKEITSRALNVPSSAPVPVSTTPVSRTGLRVLGGPTEKGEPGPPLPGNQPGPDPFDPLSPVGPRSSASATHVRGVDYKFTASIRNTGTRTIVTVQWAYLLLHRPDQQNGFAYVFTTKTNLPPGKEKNLQDQVSSISKTQSKAPGAPNRALFQERVVILRLDYLDGSSWQSAGKTGSP
jgi:Tfp pilus assembly protein PilF